MGTTRPAPAPPPVLQTPPQYIPLAIPPPPPHYRHQTTASTNLVYVAGKTHTAHLGLAAVEEVRNDPRPESTDDVFINIEQTLQQLPSPVVQIACGLRHTLLLTADGDVYGMGATGKGQLSLPKSTKYYVVQPRKITAITNVVRVGAGANISFYLTRNGKFYIGHKDAVAPQSRGSRPHHLKGLGKVYTFYCSHQIIFVACQHGLYFRTLGLHIPDAEFMVRGHTRDGFEKTCFELSVEKVVASSAAPRYGVVAILTDEHKVLCYHYQFLNDRYEAIPGRSAEHVLLKAGRIADVAASDDFLLFCNHQGEVFTCLRGHQQDWSTTSPLVSLKEYTPSRSPVTKVFAGFGRQFLVTAEQAVIVRGTNKQGQLGLLKRRRINLVNCMETLIPGHMQPPSSHTLADVVIGRDCTFLLYKCSVRLNKMYGQKAFTDVQIQFT